MRRTLVLFACMAVLALGAAACGGGGGGGRYEETGFDITWKIPGGFKIDHSARVGRSAGASAVDGAALSLDPSNLIIAQRYNLPQAITAENLSNFKKDIDGVIKNLTGKAISGRQVEYGGMPGYEYVGAVTQPPGAQSRFAVLFDGATEYFFNCQSTADERDKVEKACRTVLDSLERVS